METKVCGRCGQERPLDQFSVDNRTGNPVWCCKPCNSELVKQYDMSPQARARRAAKAQRVSRMVASVYCLLLGLAALFYLVLLFIPSS